MKLLFKYSDAGRLKSKNSDEKNDCSVRTLSITLGLDYDYCHAIMKRFGRKEREGIFGAQQNAALKYIAGKRKMSLKLIKFRKEKQMNTKKFIEHFPKGRYILNQPDHVSSIVNGTLIDTHKHWRRRVYSAWKIEVNK